MTDDIFDLKIKCLKLEVDWNKKAGFDDVAKKLKNQADRLKKKKKKVAKNNQIDDDGMSVVQSEMQPQFEQGMMGSEFFDNFNLDDDGQMEMNMPQDVDM